MWGGGWTGATSAEQRLPKRKRNNQNSEDPSGSVRDITHHLIHDSKTSTPVPCIVFHEESAGYDPGSIQSSYDFLFSDPGARWDPEAGTFLIPLFLIKIKTPKKIEFLPMFEKVTLEPYKKMETGTNRCALKNQYRRWG